MTISEWDEKRQIYPVRYGTDVVGPPPYYTPSEGDPNLVRTETYTEYFDAIPLSTTTTTIIPGDTAVAIARPSEPIEMQCPHCGQQIVTDMTYENGTLTWLLAGALVVLGCWLGCCLIPTCVKGCKDVLHTCPNCHNVVGEYRRL